MRAQVEAEPVPPSARNPNVPAAFDEIVRKALAKDRSLRFQSADEFRLALQSVSAGADPIVEPSSPPETVRDTETQVPARRRELRISRAAALMALVPAGLIAGFFTIRHFPAAAPRANAATIVKHDAAPVAPPVAARVEPEAPPVVAPAPDVPVVPEKPARRVRPRARASASSMRRAGKPEHTAIRVTGGELQPPVPAPMPLLRRDVEMPEALVSKTDSQEAAQGEGSPAAAGSDNESTTPSQEVAPLKPQNTGNRFIRAIGKLNPFRKGTKQEAGEAVKTPLKKD
jgi:serine/threonine-protein kinase